jgi:hypothetical protein
MGNNRFFHLTTCALRRVSRETFSGQPMPPRAKGKSKAPAPAPALAWKKHERLADDDSSNDEEAHRSTTSDAKRQPPLAAAAREERLAQVEQLKQDGRMIMAQSGMESVTTEGLGDCWLIAFLADQLPAAMLSGFTDKERKQHLSTWRKRLVESVPDIDSVGFRMGYNEPQALGIEYLKEVARLFHVKEAMIESDARNDNWRKTRQALKKALKPGVVL